MVFEGSMKRIATAIEQECLQVAYSFFKLTLGAHAQRELQYLWVCLSVCLSVSAKLTLRMSSRAINKCAYSVACEG